MTDMTREWIKGGARALATCLVAPFLVSFAIRRVLIGHDRALQGSTQLLALLPGLSGQYLRRAFLMRALSSCSRTATVEFGTVFSRCGARIGADAYVGSGCSLGLVDIGAGALLGPCVQVPSGQHTHGTSDPSIPIREQAGTLEQIRIGEHAWIGAGAIVMAPVGAHAIVGAGAVVTKPVAPFAIVAGIPARQVGDRRARTPHATAVSHPSAAVRA